MLNTKKNSSARAPPKPVEKRGGMRKVIRRKPSKQGAYPSPADYFKAGKNHGLFPRRLGQYRFVICTDFETDDMAYLLMFAAWLKVNEQFYDSRNVFPIYGFIVGETSRPEVKVQRAREYLHKIGDLMEWNNPEGHLFKQYLSAISRVWVDSTTDREFPEEETLVQNKDAIDSSYTTLVEGIDQLMQVKASNLIFVHLKPLQMVKLFQHSPEIMEFMRSAPAIVYGSWNCHLLTAESAGNSEYLQKYLNRFADEQPVLYVESFYSLGNDNILHSHNCKKFFVEMDMVSDHVQASGQDQAEDDSLLANVRDTMTTWNNALFNRFVDRLSDLPEFKNVDFDDYSSFSEAVNSLSAQQQEELKRPIKHLGAMIQNHMVMMSCADQLAMIAMLMASGTLRETPFKLVQSTVTFSDGKTTVTDSAESNTRVLKADVGQHEKCIKFVDSIMAAAAKVLF